VLLVLFELLLPVVCAATPVAATPTINTLAAKGAAIILRYTFM
jgi:hypothetical protein